MVRFDGQPLYPQRQCDTLSYDLREPEEQLDDATTSYITETTSVIISSPNTPRSYHISYPPWNPSQMIGFKESMY
jgi:hypothetical protein